MDYVPSPSFTEYIADSEDDKLVKRFAENPDYITYPKKSPEGGRKTTAFGHKESGDEDFSAGLTKKQSDELLNKDIIIAYNGASAYVNKTHGPNAWASLSTLEREALTDYQFNVKGGVATFPSLTDAIVNKNQAGIIKEYRRRYTDDKGEKKDLTRRNQKWWERYGRGLSGGVKRQQTAQVAKTLTMMDDLDIDTSELSFG